MKALVLAAGKSTRIASVSGGLPKPLLSIGGKPVIARTLEWLSESGVGDVWINLHYRGDDIRSALGDGSRHGVRISWAHEPEILGTAGAFRALAAHWAGTDPVLVVYGDNLMAFDLGAFAAFHARAGARGTVALFDPARHLNTRIAGGRVRLDAASRITAFVEGGTGEGYVNAGAYLLDPSVAADVAPGFQDFGRDVFPPLARAGALAGHLLEPSGYCLGLDTPESFAVAEQLVASRQVALA